ncbi:CARDB domain-containing protein [Nocardioides sp. TF02-7]|uniref:CARDB domain-containing protein n=1 Tax=Nocardioides sp. TF02-7 TaxID=2917724 RepID=UPI001F06108E|nr:CARDB domain-containing protein [Nocardioides sp. TF02-7]UMG91394.1 hypothetical protein MF408_14700 [Nocardioides sp. TF02-7]
MAARSRLLLLCSALVMAVLAPVADRAAAGPAAKPNLVVASVQAPAKVTAGGKAGVRTKIRNAGPGKVRATTTSYRLSTDRRPGADRALRPSLRTPALTPRKAWTGRVTLTVPAAVAPGTYYVIACADGRRKVREKRETDNCRASARIAVAARPTAPATSHDLIEADVQAGRISAEQGLVYKVFADFRDPRLPARYRGPADGLEHGALVDAAEQWPSLSRAGQEQLRPFLVPPFYAGSHWTPASADLTRTDGPGGTHQAAPTADEPVLSSPWCAGSDEIRTPAFETWDFEDTADGRFRIWWLADHPDDAVLAGELSAVLATVLPELESLMGRSIKSDGGGLCDGGSDAFDIAIVDAATATTYGDGPCGQAGQTAHMVWPRTKPAEWPGIEPYLAHEVMHAVQYAMPMNGSCGDYRWMMEMTAEWVQDYVTDPAYGIGLAPDDTEHLAAPLLLDRPRISLDSETPPKHDYGAYLFTQWAVRKTSPQFVGEVWANAATMKPKPALDAALPGDGFESTWDEFALSNWNRGPIRDYKDWDDLTLGAKPIGPEPVFAGHPRNPSVHVDHLAAQYLELDIDEGVTELEVENDLAGDEHAKLRAVITYDDGNHAIVDLSDQQKTVLCIDDGARRAVSVVLIFSNAHQTDAKDFGP